MEIITILRTDRKEIWNYRFSSWIWYWE